MSLEQALHKRNRSRIRSRRSTPHPFVPSAGHPDLCAGCNAGPDDFHRGKVIHVAPKIQGQSIQLSVVDELP